MRCRDPQVSETRSPKGGKHHLYVIKMKAQVVNAKTVAKAQGLNYVGATPGSSPSRTVAQVDE